LRVFPDQALLGAFYEAAVFSLLAVNYHSHLTHPDMSFSYAKCVSPFLLSLLIRDPLGESVSWFRNVTKLRQVKFLAA